MPKLYASDWPASSRSARLKSNHLRAAIRLTREIFAQKAFDPYRWVALLPGPAVKTDAEIDAHIRAHGESAYHPSGSCKMGIDSDPMAVVDGERRVHGLEALRVVDASLMPHMVSGNLNAPTIMMAEKLSDAFLGRGAAAPLRGEGLYRAELRDRAAAIRRGPHCPRGDSVLFN